MAVPTQFLAEKKKISESEGNEKRIYGKWRP
jgi:hypothetical protein